MTTGEESPAAEGGAHPSLEALLRQVASELSGAVRALHHEAERLLTSGAPNEASSEPS